ncbi:MAG: hypothetical protein AAF614_06205 [Chloroflexota bacterium]
MFDENKARLKQDFYDLQEAKKRDSQQTDDSLVAFLKPIGFLSRWVLAPALPLIVGSELPGLISKWIAEMPQFFSTSFGTIIFSGFVIVAFVVLAIIYYVYIFRRFRHSNTFGLVVFLGSSYLIAEFF